MKTNTYEQILASKDARIAELEALVKIYEEQLRISKSKQYSPSSETGEQLGLFDEVEVTANSELPEPELEQIAYTRRKKVGKREQDLSGLPVEVVEHHLPEEEQVCPECGGALHVMGHDCYRRELKIVPAQVLVTEHRRSIYACRDCEKSGLSVPIIKAPAPKPVISGSLASPSAVAHIMVQKYAMHVPLYRQEQDWKRQGVNLSRQTMANWVIHCAEDWLQPVYDRMKKLLPEYQTIHADESTVQVLREPGRAATSKSYMWLYRTSGDTNRHIVLYEYQPSRAQVHPQRFLGGFSGYLHADGYAGYNNLPDCITRVGCWTHCRRPFVDALKVIPQAERAGSVPQQAIIKIGELFKLEDRWRNLSPDERYRRRLDESKPKAEEFFAWIESMRVLPKDALGKAVSYALGQKKWLMNVYLDGRTELSNNRAKSSSLRDPQELLQAA
ncbi:MAG: IS66 family transposase [Symbiobacteriaceae bacterium]|nr:IS66 family transposase [Symbiobacteriaceae bacterium]